MGSYLGRLCPPPPPQAPKGQCRSHSAHHLTLARQSHPGVHVPPSTCKPNRKYSMTLPLNFVRAFPRRYSRMPQSLRFFLEVFTSLYRHGHQRKAALSAPDSKMACSSVSLVDKITLCVAQEQVFTRMPPTTPTCAPNSCTEQVVLRAPGESWKETAKQEQDDPAIIQKQANQRRGPDGTGGTQTAFRPLGVQRGLSPLVPRPGPLQRISHMESSEDTSNKKSRTSGISFCPRRNAITSSYSSTQGFLPVQTRRVPSTSHTQLSSKKVSQEGSSSPHSASEFSASVFSQRKSQQEKDADVTKGQKRTWRNCSPTPDSSRPPKRKFPLLPHRRRDPLRLPSPPELSFRVTAEDLDSEKKAALQHINNVLWGETETIPNCSAVQPLSSPPSPAAGVAPAPAVPPAPSMDPQLVKCRRKQDSSGPEPILESAGGATSVHPLSSLKHSSPGSLFTLSEPLPGTSTHSLPSAPFTMLTGPSSQVSGKADLSAGPPNPSAPATFSALGMDCAVSSPPPHWPVLTAAAASPPPLMLKPIWGTPLNGGGGGPLQPKTLDSAAAASPPPLMLKPIWGTPLNGGGGGPLQPKTLDSAAAASPPPLMLKPIWGTPLNGGGGGPLQPKTLVSAAANATFTFPAAPSTFRTDSPTEMCVDPPVSSQGPPPITDPSASPSTGTSAVSASPLISTSAGLAPHPAFDTGVTSMGSTLPSQPFLSGAPPGTSGSFFLSAQTLQTRPSGSMASVTVATSPPAPSFCRPTPTLKLPVNPGATAQPIIASLNGQQHRAITFDSSAQRKTLAAPAPAQAPTSAPGQPTLGSITWTASRGSLPTTSAFSTYASTQPAFAATPTVFPSGTATASGFAVATNMPNAMTNAGPKGQQHCSTWGITSSTSFRVGVSAAPMGFRNRAATPDLSCTFRALNITTEMSKASSTKHPHGGSLGLKTCGPPRQSTHMRTTGPSTNTWVSGGTTASTLSYIHGGVPKQSPLTSKGGSSPTASKAAFKGIPVSVSTPSSPASVMGTTRKSLAIRAPSSPVQGLVGHKTIGQSTKSFSSKSKSTPLGSKRQIVS
ncbi:nuclear envelope pore membrane protein POM 121 [Pteropus alecto]|uniref:nuclear envelope pore membrane protein POM 121 n=1 Tax=Pteropus alecto TaxID=9402 RepID=UPI000D532C9F|nr:nuclear envelope pore membrane protein POM 121 [Pteropus alecto]